jgi:alkaline phosphatase
MTQLQGTIVKYAATLLLFVFITSGIAAQQAKYVFYFIGDGMGFTHVAATEAYLSSLKGEAGFEPLNFSQFPTTGIATAEAENRLITGSAAAGTALATGQKTTVNTISMDGRRKRPLSTIAEDAKAHGLKVGIISSVSINHATPAVFYAHQPLRTNYYEIGLDLVNSGFDFFGGGGVNRHSGNDGDLPSIYDLARDAGYTITTTQDEFNRLKPGDEKVIAVGSVIEGSGALRYAIDQDDSDIPLESVVEKATQLLYNEQGFFIMTEEGKIDWAAHANDGATVINNVISLAEAVEAALNFYEKYPDETLIVVTADHETGGMTLGYATSRYDSQLSLLQLQKMSTQSFTILSDSLLDIRENQTFDFAMSLVAKYYGIGGETGLTLTNYEKQLFEEAWQMMTGMSEMDSDAKHVLYGGGSPLAATATRILNNRAGLGWTTWSHTGAYVPVYAIGQGHELFNGYYHISEIPQRIRRAMGMSN